MRIRQHDFVYETAINPAAVELTGTGRLSEYGWRAPPVISYASLIDAALSRILISNYLAANDRMFFVMIESMIDFLAE